MGVLPNPVKGRLLWAGRVPIGEWDEEGKSFVIVEIPEGYKAILLSPRENGISLRKFARWPLKSGSILLPNTRTLGAGLKT
jgi:hypothetical protein